MPRRRYNLTKEKISKLIKDGRGCGEKEQYDPWLKIGDFASLGRGNRVNTPNSKRVHHFFSDLEKDFFFHLLWDDSIIDIREQFPLRPVEETVEIAEKLGFKPPKPYKSGCAFMMTTDMLVTFKENNKEKLIAYTIKPSNELEKDRVLEKLAIEETYWGYRDVPYEIITENKFDRMVARNIFMLFSHATIETEISQEVIDHIYDELVDGIFYYKGKGKKINDICKDIDVRNGYEKGLSLRLFYYYAALKDIPVKLEHLIVGTCIVDDVVNYKIFENMMKGDAVNGNIV